MSRIYAYGYRIYIDSKLESIGDGTYLIVEDFSDDMRRNVVNYLHDKIRIELNLTSTSEVALTFLTEIR